MSCCRLGLGVGARSPRCPHPPRPTILAVKVLVVAVGVIADTFLRVLRKTPALVLLEAFLCERCMEASEVVIEKLLVLCELLLDIEL